MIDRIVNGQRFKKRSNCTYQFIFRVKTLISSFYRDSDVKKELNTKIRRNEEEIAKQTNINDKLSREKRNL